MNQYYRATIKISFEDKKGNLKYKKENYIVFAMSPSDVEAKLSKYLGVEDYELIGVNLVGIVDVIK
jgi:hypothetical protein